MTKNDYGFLSEFATEIEGTSIELEKTVSLVELFYECLEKEVDYVKPDAPWSVKLMKDRVDRLLVFLSVIERSLTTIRKDIDTNFDTVRSFLAVESAAGNVLNADTAGRQDCETADTARRA